MKIDLNSQKKKIILFCPPDWLHSHDMQGVYFDWLKNLSVSPLLVDRIHPLTGKLMFFYSHVDRYSRCSPTKWTKRPRVVQGGRRKLAERLGSEVSWTH